MNKKLIRLTEQDLHRIVKESVNRILNEAAYDMNSPEYKRMFDSGGWDEEDDEMNREIRDYEALPDKARHPYGADIPNFNDRIDLRKTQGYWGNHYGDKLAAKKAGSVYKKQQDKREHEQYVSERYKEAMRDLPFCAEYLHDKFGIHDPRKIPKEVIVNTYDRWIDKQEEERRESEWYL